MVTNVHVPCAATSKQTAQTSKQTKASKPPKQVIPAQWRSTPGRAAYHQSSPGRAAYYQSTPGRAAYQTWDLKIPEPNLRRPSITPTRGPHWLKLVRDKLIDTNLMIIINL